MELMFVDRNHTEWELMWRKLAQHPINEGIERPTIAENGSQCWQYMCSALSGKSYVHHFRHRLHPATNQKVLVEIEASSNDALMFIQPEQITQLPVEINA